MILEPFLFGVAAGLLGVAIEPRGLSGIRWWIAVSSIYTIVYTAPALVG